MRRFWKDVAIVDRAIRLDDRPVKTPARAALVLPTDILARAVAEEWRAVGEEVDPRSMPFTGLANAAIDIVSPAPAPFAANLARYAGTDLLCYRATMPEPLVVRQAMTWDPLLAWARGRYDIHFELVEGVMHRPQPPATLDRLGEAVHARGAFALAALAPIVTISGSLVAALALIEGAVDVETVWRASQLDEDWQAEMWGDDPLAAGARNERHRDLHAAARFLEMLG